MSTIRYHKLVRDRIPEVIEKAGKTCETRVLSDAEYLEMAERKMTEELAEYTAEPSVEEMADLLESMHAAAKARGWSWDDVEAARAAKAEKRGAFEKKLLLLSVTEADR